jgi:hypothetical protein
MREFFSRVFESDVEKMVGRCEGIRRGIGDLKREWRKIQLVKGSF